MYLDIGNMVGMRSYRYRSCLFSGRERNVLKSVLNVGRSIPVKLGTSYSAGNTLFLLCR